MLLPHPALAFASPGHPVSPPFVTVIIDIALRHPTLSCPSCALVFAFKGQPLLFTTILLDAIFIAFNRELGYDLALGTSAALWGGLATLLSYLLLI
jgi:hypothetical protein